MLIIKKENNDEKNTCCNSLHYQLADNAIVYVWDKTAKNWTIGAAADLKDKIAKLYNTKADDKSAGYEVVMAY